MSYLDTNGPCKDPLQKQPESQPLSTPTQIQLILKGFVIGSRPVGSGSAVRTGRKCRYPLDDLEVTQFFEVMTKKEATSVRSAIFNLRKKHPEKHFSVVQEPYTVISTPPGSGSEPSMTLYKWICQRIA